MNSLMLCKIRSRYLYDIDFLPPFIDLLRLYSVISISLHNHDFVCPCSFKIFSTFNITTICPPLVYFSTFYYIHTYKSSTCKSQTNVLIYSQKKLQKKEVGIVKETTMLKLLNKLGCLIMSNHIIEAKQLIEVQIKKLKETTD